MGRRVDRLAPPKQDPVSRDNRTSGHVRRLDVVIVRSSNQRGAGASSGRQVMLKPVDTREALEQLEQLGHTVEYKPILNGSRLMYHVDGKPLTEDEVMKWVVDGVRPSSLTLTSTMTIEQALNKLSSLGHLVELRVAPLVRDGVEYFRIDGLFRSEKQILDYLITGKSLLTSFELEQGHRLPGDE